MLKIKECALYAENKTWACNLFFVALVFVFYKAYKFLQILRSCFTGKNITSSYFYMICMYWVRVFIQHL